VYMKQQTLVVGAILGVGLQRSAPGTKKEVVRMHQMLPEVDHDQVVALMVSCSIK
jgi:hypothetical protein